MQKHISPLLSVDSTVTTSWLSIFEYFECTYLGLDMIYAGVMYDYLLSLLTLLQTLLQTLLRTFYTESQ